jgi:hypothetical protein
LDCYVIPWGRPSEEPGQEMKRSGGAIAPAVLAKKKTPVRIDIIGEPETDELRAFGGSRSDKFNGVLINAMARTGWFPPGQTDEACNQQMFAAVAALRAFKPTDEIEGMLAAQTVAMHFGAMECFRRAMVHDQPPEVASKLRKDGANLARGMTDMLEALDRKRGKGPQVVRVERVVVNEGGQAIVGNVQPAVKVRRGRDEIEISEQPCIPRASSEPERQSERGSPLRRARPPYPLLQSTGHAKRTVPVARRQVHRAADVRGAGADAEGQDNARRAHG